MRRTERYADSRRCGWPDTCCLRTRETAPCGRRPVPRAGSARIRSRRAPDAIDDAAVRQEAERTHRQIAHDAVETFQREAQGLGDVKRRKGATEECRGRLRGRQRNELRSLGLHEEINRG